MAKKRTQIHGFGKAQMRMESVIRQAVADGVGAQEVARMKRLLKRSMQGRRPAGSVPPRKMNTATTLGGRYAQNMRGY